MGGQALRRGTFFSPLFLYLLSLSPTARLSLGTHSLNQFTPPQSIHTITTPNSDGNPNVTAKTTHHVTALGRWMAADLYLREVDVLRFEVRACVCVGGGWLID